MGCGAFLKQHSLEGKEVEGLEKGFEVDRSAIQQPDMRTVEAGKPGGAAAITSGYGFDEERIGRGGQKLADVVTAVEQGFTGDAPAVDGICRQGAGYGQTLRIENDVVDQLVVRQHARLITVEAAIKFGAGAPAYEFRAFMRAERRIPEAVFEIFRDADALLAQS